MKIKIRDIYVPIYVKEDLGMTIAKAKEGNYDYYYWNERIHTTSTSVPVGTGKYIEVAVIDEENANEAVGVAAAISN